MYKALYRTYRPETFDNLLGQEHIVKILKNQINTQTTNHAYLFSGTRGTGKTTVARILAKALNCLEDGEKPCGTCKNCTEIRDGIYLDVIEIDAASNNGVDNIRDLKESVKYPPAIGKRKVYIIDEVHMLSTGAFNALLKTLEEPPEYITFILATTEVHKLPATILSRCLRLDFRRVSENKLKDGVKRICADIGIDISDSAIGIITSNADGSVRDCLSILDQCLSSGKLKVTREDVLEYLGTSGEAVYIEMTDLVIQHKVSEALILLDKILSEGNEVRQFMKDWMGHYRNLMLSKFVKNPEDIINMSCENVDKVKAQSDRIDMSEISEAILQLSKSLNEAKWSTQPRILLEMCIVNMTLINEYKDNAFQKNPYNDKKSENVIEQEIKKEEKISVVNKDSIAKDFEKELSDEVNLDLDQLWHRIFEDGETTKGSYNLIRNGTVLRGISKETFLVEVVSEIKKTYVMDNKRGLEKLMEKHTGTKRLLECKVINGNKIIDENEKIQQQKNQIESKFGISIEIE